ncbi:MAG: DUF1588 domain-containing protein [Myxococcota bacterium]|nr:DUF1588 domain-containing protein [Myxococcota bacterium]
MSATIILAVIAGCATDTAAPAGLTMLSSREQLIRLSVDLRGVHPSETELQYIEANPDLYEDYVNRYMDDSRFAERMREVFALRFLTRTDNTYGHMVDGATSAEVSQVIGDEPLRLLSYIIDNDLPYSEMVLADYTIANPLLAEVWNLDREETEDGGWSIAHYTDGRPEAGILTMNSIWSRYPSMDGNANRHRANAVSNMLLCDDFLSRPIVLDRAAVDQLTLDPESAIGENPSCQSCHSTLDPLSAHFFGFYSYDDNDFTGVYKPELEENWRLYANKAPGFYGVPTANIPEMAELLAEDSRFMDCAVQTVWEGLTQRTIVDDDWEEIQSHRSVFVDSDQSVRTLVRSVVLSDGYRAAGSDDPEVDARLAGLKMVSPAQFSAIIADITGYEWSFGGRDGLTNHGSGLPVLLGGIDGDTVTTRSYDPSVGAVFIQERLAQSAGYAVASHDLSSTRTDDATLLLYVTIEDTPESNPEAFDAQIRHLYLAATGMPLDEDATEPSNLMVVWEQVYSIEGSVTAAWAAVISAVLRDPRVLTY